MWGAVYTPQLSDNAQWETTRSNWALAFNRSSMASATYGKEYSAIMMACTFFYRLPVPSLLLVQTKYIIQHLWCCKLFWTSQALRGEKHSNISSFTLFGCCLRRFFESSSLDCVYSSGTFFLIALSSFSWRCLTCFYIWPLLSLRVFTPQQDSKQQQELWRSAAFRRFVRLGRYIADLIISDYLRYGRVCDSLVVTSDSFS